MDTLRLWIKENGNVKKFLEGVGMSRSYFSEWESGKKRISLQLASRIVKHTKGQISFENLVDFENSFDRE